MKYQHQDRSEKYWFRLISIVRMTWRNILAELQYRLRCFCSVHELSQSYTEQTRGDCLADDLTALSRDLQLDDN